MFEPISNDRASRFQALVALGQLKRRRGDRAASLAALEAAAAIDQNNIAIQLEIADDLRELSRLDEAEAILQRVVAEDPANAQPLIALGYLKRSRGDRAASLVAFEAAAAIDQSNSNIQLQIASDLRELGRLNDADAVLQRAIALDPNTAKPLVALAHLKRRQGNRAASLAAFEAAAAIDPYNTDVQVEIAEDFRELGRLDDAEAVLQHLIAQDPTIRPLMAFGYLKRRSGDYAASLAAFEAAAAIDPKDLNIQVQIALDLRELGRLADAETILNRAIALDSTTAKPLMALGHLKRRQGDRVASLAAFETAATIDRKDASIQLEIVNDLTELGRLDEAEAILERLLSVAT
jgi:tetratricopeptide (TPR) repeat protein